MAYNRVRISGMPGGRLRNAKAIKQMPFAMALALTRSAQQGQLVGKAHLARNLRTAKPFTLNSVQFDKATKARLKSAVRIRDEAAKGTPPAKYLRVLETGGVRRLKRFERALQAAGVLEPNEFAIPADGGSIDLRGNGNVGGLYTRILTGLKATGSTDAYTRDSRATPRRRRSRTTYFRSGSFIWERINIKRVRPVLVIIQRAPSYSRSLRFTEVVNKAAKDAMPVEFRRALRQAMATAR